MLARQLQKPVIWQPMAGLHHRGDNEFNQPVLPHLAFLSESPHSLPSLQAPHMCISMSLNPDTVKSAWVGRDAGGKNPTHGSQSVWLQRAFWSAVSLIWVASRPCLFSAFFISCPLSPAVPSLHSYRSVLAASKTLSLLSPMFLHKNSGLQSRNVFISLKRNWGRI